jgi:glycosyltransferase involved in cell wall biosynthesis
MDKLPVITVFGHDDFSLETPTYADYEEKRLDTRCYSTDENLEAILIKDRPHVIITIGDLKNFTKLLPSPLGIRKRWLHYDSLPDLKALGLAAYNCYLRNLFDPHWGETETPLVSVFTPAYKTGELIYRPYLSLLEQTYKNWEWIICDDSEEEKTFKMLLELARKDHRIHVFRYHEHSGVIGKLKNWACSLATGSLLVELDHDDSLTDYALDKVVSGFKKFPEAGFLYTDCAEIFDSGENATYPDGFAFGYGTYKDVEYKGKIYKSAQSPNMNSKTIRHIVSVPNHIRAWRKDFYQSIGGHNKDLHVCDDYELIVRTFLKTRMVRVPEMCYIQYIHNSTQRVRNKEIQRSVRAVRVHNDRAIHDRFVELGCDDFMWDEKNGWSDWNRPNPEREPHTTLIAGETKLCLQCGKSFMGNNCWCSAKCCQDWKDSQKPKDPIPAVNSSSPGPTGFTLEKKG